MSTDSNDPMLRVLWSPEPNAEHREKLMQFAPLIGSWDLDVIYYDELGQVKRRTPGEWHFGWVLEGRAVEDVWIVPPRSQRPSEGPAAGEYGVTLRFYDPRIDAWRSTWHGPVNGIVWSFLARQVGDELVLERTQEDGSLTRWIFSEIEQESFHWRAVVSTDQGCTWRLEQEMFARRQPEAKDTYQRALRLFPDISARPYQLTIQRLMSAPPGALFKAWTEQFDLWFAAPGTLLMKAEVNSAFFFEVHAEGQRYPHYGRFLRLQRDRLIELTWVTGEGGTRGTETVVTVELIPRGEGTLLQLTHSGFPDADSRDLHQQAWPAILSRLDERIAES